MADKITASIEAALQLLDAVEDADAFLPGDAPVPDLRALRVTLESALASLRQQPLMIDGIEVFVRLRAAAQTAGSEAALARDMGVTRQHLSDVMNSRKEPGPAVLNYLRLRRVGGRTLYTPDDAPRPAPKPRSERRQRAWDGLPGAGPAPAAALHHAR